MTTFSSPSNQCKQRIFTYQPLILYCYILASINLTYINQSQHICKCILFFFLSKHISNVFIIEILLLMYHHYEERERLTKPISRRLKKRFFLGVFTVFTSETINSTYGKTNSSWHLKDSTDFINFIEKHEQNYLQTHGNPMGTEMVVAFANIFMAKIEI